MNANNDLGLSREDLRTLRAIDVLRHARGYSPTVRELAELLDRASSSVVHLHLRRLEEAGLIECPVGPGSRRRYGYAVVTEAGVQALQQHPDVHIVLTPANPRAGEASARPGAEEE